MRSRIPATIEAVELVVATELVVAVELDDDIVSL
jgi:hypothetical protein